MSPQDMISIYSVRYVPIFDRATEKEIDSVLSMADCVIVNTVEDQSVTLERSLLGIHKDCKLCPHNVISVSFYGNETFPQWVVAFEVNELNLFHSELLKSVGEISN